jgi:hypothetical protein
MPRTLEAAEAVRKAAAEWPPEPPPGMIYSLLRLLGRWRSLMLADAYIARQGAEIWSGPFQGMQYVHKATEGALIPRLLGTYESELHPHFDAIAEAGLDCVIDVGCAEGYYAVGLARRWPAVTVYAHDISDAAQAACSALAQMNGVADRVVIGGAFSPGDFQAFAGRRALVLVDVEGAEVDILRPDLAPALASMSLIVETHDVYRKDALATLIDRFSPTHDIVVVEQQPKTFEMPPWLRKLPHLDQLLAVWEWRLWPTPWLVIRPKAT